MLFDLILTQKLITLGILSKCNLSIKELNSLTYPLLFKDKSVNSAIPTHFEKNRLYNKPIRSTVLNYNK